MTGAERAPVLTGKRRKGPESIQADLSEKIAQGHDAELVAKTLGDELRHRREEIERGIFQHLGTEQPLSGDKAIQSWLELYAVHRLEQHLRRKMGLGVAAGKTLAGQLESPETPSARPLKSQFPHT